MDTFLLEFQPCYYDQIVLIDDDYIHNMITRKVLQKFVNAAAVDIILFDDPKAGLKHLLDSDLQCHKTLIFLDLNMPLLSGWDILDELKNTGAQINNNLTLCILSSSINAKDLERALQYPFIENFISKPLSFHLYKILDKAAIV